MPFEQVHSLTDEFRKEAQRRSESNQVYEESFQQDLNYRQQEAKKAGDDWEALAKLTKSGQEVILEEGKKLAKQEIAEGEEKGREFEEGREIEKEKLEADIAALDKDANDYKDELNKLKDAHPTALEAIESLEEGLSPHQRRGFHQYRMKSLATKVWPTELKRRYALELDAALEADPTVTWTPAKEREVINKIARNFVVENLPTKNKSTLALRSKYFYPEFDRVTTTFTNATNLASGAAKGISDQNELFTNYSADITEASTLTLIGDLQRTRYKDGSRFLSRPEAWAMWEQRVVNLRRSGDIDNDEWSAIGNQAHPTEKGKKLKDHNRYILAEKAFIKAENQDRNTAIKKEQLDAKENADYLKESLTKQLETNPYFLTASRIEDIKKDFINENDYWPPSMDTWLSINSATKSQINDRRKVLEGLKRNGRLTQQALNASPAVLQREFEGKADFDGTAKEHKTNKKAVSRLIGKTLKISPDKELQFKGVQAGIERHLHAFYMDAYLGYKAQGVGDVKAMNLALKDTSDFWDQNGGNIETRGKLPKGGKDSLFYYNAGPHPTEVDAAGYPIITQSGFYNWEKQFLERKGTSAPVKGLGDDEKFYNSKVDMIQAYPGGQNKIETILKIPNSVWSVKELEKIEEYWEANKQLPPDVLALSAAIGKGGYGIDLVNLARRSSDPPLKDLKASEGGEVALDLILKTNFSSNDARTALRNWQENPTPENQAKVLAYYNGKPLPTRNSSTEE